MLVRGALRTRKWQDQSGNDRYSTEIHLTPYNGTLKFLNSRKDESRAPGDDVTDPPHEPATGDGPDPDEEIPF